MKWTSLSIFLISTSSVAETVCPEPSHWRDPVTWFTALLALVGIIQARIIHNQFKDGQRSSEAAVLNAKVAAGVQLPSLVVAAAEIGFTPVVSRSGSGPESLEYHCKVAIAFKNYGKTPAFLLSRSLEVLWGPKLPPHPTYPTASPVPPETVVEAQKSYSLRTGSSVMHPNAYKTLQDKETQFWVYGFITYKDYLGDTHTTRFGKQLVSNGDLGGINKFVDIANPEYTRVPLPPRKRFWARMRD